MKGFPEGVVYLRQKRWEAWMSNLFWWLRQIVLISIGAFFLYFGIRLLISAYEFNDPFTFLMTFFASNFIILISGTLIIGFIYRMITVYRLSKNSDSWTLCRKLQLPPCFLLKGQQAVINKCMQRHANPRCSTQAHHRSIPGLNYEFFFSHF